MHLVANSPQLNISIGKNKNIFKLVTYWDLGQRRLEASAEIKKTKKLH